MKMLHGPLPFNSTSGHWVKLNTLVGSNVMSGSKSHIHRLSKKKRWPNKEIPSYIFEFMKVFGAVNDFLRKTLLKITLSGVFGWI